LQTLLPMNGLTASTDRYWRQALWLAVFTIADNLVEGAVSVFFGIQDEVLALFGFGIDSFIEMLSGADIPGLTMDPLLPILSSTR
jgi:hypothetical protein